MKAKALYNFDNIGVYISTYPNGITKGQILDIGEVAFNYLIEKGYAESLEESKMEEFVCEDCKLPEVENDSKIEEQVEEKPKKKNHKKKVEDEHANNN
jgi:hypothetical protein